MKSNDTCPPTRSRSKNNSALPSSKRRKSSSCRESVRSVSAKSSKSRSRLLPKRPRRTMIRIMWVLVKRMPGLKIRGLLRLKSMM